MSITITRFAKSPDKGRGLARDMRVRWALEEVGQPYQMRLLSFNEMKEPDHLALQPFGQIPTFEDEALVLFETGAIILHIAERWPGLLPDDAAARGRAISWIFAALNTVEPTVIEREMALIVERDEPWFDARLPKLDDNIHKRLEALSKRLGDAEWLETRFSAGDIMMVSVLLRLKATPLLAAYENLSEYLARGEARPAYQRAFADQLSVFEAAQKQQGALS